MYKHTWVLPKAKVSNVDNKLYTINGHSYCRVTKTLGIVAKAGLASWYARMGTKRAGAVLKNRQGFGTNVHHMFEHILIRDFKKDAEMKGEMLECYNNFEVFKKQAKLRPQELEVRLWNDEYGYAGTCDYIGKYTTWKPYCVRGHNRDFKNELVILDWKTSSNIYDESFLQLAAYAYAFWKLTGIKIAGGAIVQFRNNRIKIKERDWDELMALFEVYKSVLILYKWKNKIED
ncbi:MAG: hypothetical protein DRO67_07405 [Candidatus Asgardarchaeum californiense]|nr:MAG: hypothetical protein DRO67_07405 [Candidatus Asgardarchaeum californiense]